MNYPVVQFTAGPDVDAEVRFDFNSYGEWSDDETWPEHDDFTLGVPALEGDPDAYGVQYGLRELSFNLIVRGTYTDASKVWSRLAKELVTRRTNWLLFRFSEHSDPVWFKTYRTAPEALDFEQVNDTDDAAANLWGIGVSLTAEPFAYGERVEIPAFTVQNNPAAGANPCFKILPEILGDAPAPARYDMGTATLHSIPSPMFGVTPVRDSFTGPYVYQFGTGDAATTYVDVGDPVDLASASGGSYRPITFATNAGMARRVSIVVAPRPGRYAVWLRVSRASANGVFSFQAVPNRRVNGEVVTMDRPDFGSPGYAQWVDLGTFAFPTGLEDYESETMWNSTLELNAARISGTGDARLDVLMLIPVEQFEGERGMRLTTLPDFLGDSATYTNRWDGDEGYHQIYRGSAIYSLNPSVLAGQFPVLTPGRKNAFFMLRQTQSAARDDGRLGDLRATTNNSDTTSMQTTVTISYHPRFLWLAGS